MRVSTAGRSRVARCSASTAASSSACAASSAASAAVELGAGRRRAPPGRRRGRPWPRPAPWRRRPARRRRGRPPRPAAFFAAASSAAAAARASAASAALPCGARRRRLVGAGCSVADGDGLGRRVGGGRQAGGEQRERRRRTATTAVAAARRTGTARICFPTLVTRSAPYAAPDPADHGDPLDRSWTAECLRSTGRKPVVTGTNRTPQPLGQSQPLRLKPRYSARQITAMSSQHRGVAVLPAQLGHVVEVHAVDPGDRGRDGRDRHPGRDPAHVLVLLHADLGEVGVEHRGEQVVEALDLLGDPDRVVGDVAEERLHPLVHVRDLAGWPACAIGSTSGRTARRNSMTSRLRL